MQYCKNIYKYYSQKSWEFFINNIPTIRFSPLLDTNDPNEARINITAICKKDLYPDGLREIKTKLDDKNIGKLFDYLILIGWSAFDAAQHIQMDSLRKQMYTYNIKNYGVFCATQEIDNPALWAYYGDNGDGFALELDSNELIFTHRDFESLPLGELHTVNYTQDVPKKTLVELFNDPSPIYFTKSKYWEQEKEVRCVRHIGSDIFINNPVGGLYRISEKLVKSIIFGYKNKDGFIKDKIEQCRNIKELRNVKFLKVKSTFEKYKLDLENIND